jgi:glycosyltransferase involved in cell wall biosynthesis
VLKVNWFSPLPPARSGIAHFAMQVLPVLARHHEVVLWTDQEQVDPEVETVGRVVRYDPAAPPWRTINEAVVSIYHMGNHPDFHGAIRRLSVQQPGIIVLHDLCLHDLFFRIWVHSGNDRESYLAALERWYGEEGWHAGKAFCSGGISSEVMSRKFPLTREALRGALGVITHSPHAFEQLHEVPSCPVAALDFPYAPPAQSRYDASAASHHATSGPPYRLVIFGYLGRNRRLGPVLEALAGVGERDKFRLDICGELWDEGQVRAQIARLGLGSIVNLHGFLSDDQVGQKLGSSHLAINLRYPSMGEASLSQLQFWDHGLPTLVTRTGWYASLPEDTVAFVRPEQEITDIKTHLCSFLADPGVFRAMGARGRQSLVNNDPERYVEAMMRFASEALQVSTRVPALSLAQRVGSDLSVWLHPGASRYVLERASDEIFTVFEGRPRE